MKFRIPGTIISSQVGTKISLPFDVKLGIPGMANIDQNSYANKSEERVDEMEEENEERVEEEEQVEEQLEEKHEYKPPNQSDEKGQSSVAHFGHSPSFYPYQYSSFINPNLSPYLMHSGAPISPGAGFIPYNFVPSPPPSPPQTLNLQESHMMVQKPARKKPSNNHHRKSDSKEPPKDSNDQFTHVEKPNNLPMPFRQVTAGGFMNPSQIYPNQANGFLGQSNAQLNPFNTYTHPFNGPFSNGVPFYSNGYTPFYNYMNPLNFYNGNPYQTGPNFNVARNSNGPLAHQTTSNKLEDHSRHFANRLSARNRIHNENHDANP